MALYILIFTFTIIALIGHFISKKGGALIDIFEIKKQNSIIVMLKMFFIYSSGVVFFNISGFTYSLGYSGMWTALIASSSGYVPWLFLGKRFAKKAKEYKAKNFIELIRMHYQSNFLAILCGILTLMLIFWLIVTQLVGARYVIDVATNNNGDTLFIFYVILISILFCVIGIKPLNLFNVALGLVIFCLSCFLIYTLIQVGGGLVNIKDKLFRLDPQYFTPLGPETSRTSYLYIFSYWLYLGFGVLGVPTTSYRPVTYENSLKSAILGGTIIIFIMCFNMSFIGLLSITLLNKLSHSDEVVPMVIKSFTPEWVSTGLFFIILLMLMSAIKLFLATVANASESLIYKIPNIKKTNLLILKKVSLIIYIYVAGYIAFVYKLKIFSIILIAVGGFASAFAWMFIFIPFNYRFVNKGAAVTSIIFGIMLYSLIFSSVPNWRIYMYPAALPVVLGLFVYIISGYIYYFFTKVLYRILS